MSTTSTGPSTTPLGHPLALAAGPVLAAITWVACATLTELPPAAVATAPNAVMYGSGRVPLKRMAREGLVLNLCGAVAIATVCWLTLG
jgi:sodium-dependent dicarboxylate transporter 2/3/5